MLRAFVSMGNTLNLSETCRRLGSTRQTVRRHISELEKIRGEQLFIVSDNKYELTQNGEACLVSAQMILLDIDTWSKCSPLERYVADGLEAKKYTHHDGRKFYSQQQPISRLVETGEPLLQAALRAWAASATQVEHDAMKAIRPYSVLYRKNDSGWVFVEVGQESAYTKWFGWEWSRSAIGRFIHEDGVGDEYNEFIDEAYASVYHEGGVRLDHLYATLPREGGAPEAITYQRLLLGVVFPDRTLGLLVVVVLTNDVQIDALDTSKLREVPEELKHILPESLLLTITDKI